jgi:flagellar biosynthetic protein FliS
MAHPQAQHEAATRLSASAPVKAIHGPVANAMNIPDQYELLLSKLSKAERELENADLAGRSGYLEEASGIVFDLLYSLDYKHGGELVPRLAALYGYIGNELLNVGKTGDRVQLAHLRDMITTLRQSWYGGESGA